MSIILQFWKILSPNNFAKLKEEKNSRKKKCVYKVVLNAQITLKEQRTYFPLLVAGAAG